MADRVDQRVLHGAHHALGLLLLRQPEGGVQARDHPVELLEQVVVVVERAVRQDVRLGAGEHLDPVRHVERPDALDLAAQLVGRDVVAEAVRGRVVGDRDVLVAALARRGRHLLDRVAAVGGDGVQWRSPRMSPSSISSGSSVFARGRQLAAVLAQLGRDPLHAEPLVDLLLGRDRRPSRRSRRRRCRTRSRAGRASPPPCAAPRCAARAGEVLKQVAEASSGTIRRSTGRPEWVSALAPASPEACTSSTASSRGERLDQRRRVAGRGHDVEVLDGVGPAPGAAGELDPIAAGCSRSAATSSSPTTSAFESSSARLGRPSAPAASAASTFSSALAPKPGTSFRRPCSAGRRAGRRATRRPSSSYSSRARLGPRPGMRVTSTRPDGIRAFSLSADGIEPVSSSASIFSAIVLPTPASSVDATLASPAPPPRRPPRGSPWRRCGRPRRGRRSRRRARTGSPARRSASAISPLRMGRD